jgi:cytochrome c
VFQSSCGICHSVRVGQNGVGPTLSGIVGSKTGGVAGYNYSPANEAANPTWDEATLDKYLEAPRATMPGTKMTFGGLKDARKRGDLIAYLRAGLGKSVDGGGPSFAHHDGIGCPCDN